MDTNLKLIQVYCKVIKSLNYRAKTDGWETVNKEEKDTLIPFLPTEFEILADQNYFSFNTINVAEM